LGRRYRSGLNPLRTVSHALLGNHLHEYGYLLVIIRAVALFGQIETRCMMGTLQNL